MAASVAGMAAPAHAQLAPGDILVADFEGGENGAGLLFLVKGDTGDRTVLSDFGNPGQGPTGQSPYGVAVVDADTVLVVDNQGVSGSGTLFIVDGATGVRTILSDFGDPAQGPLGVEPVGVALGSGGILVTDIEAGTGGAGALFRVHPLTGVRTLLSDFGNAAQGPLGKTPTGVARGPNGLILVADPDAGTDVPSDGKEGGNGALFTVDPVTGTRTLLSDFGNAAQGPTGVNPGGVVMGPDNAILVVDTEAAGGGGALFRVNPVTGARTVLSSFGNAAQGPTGTDPVFVAVSPIGILVTDDDGGTDLPLDGHTGGNGALFIVNPTTGARTLRSDFGNVAKGPTGVNPVGVAIVPLIRGGDALVIDFVVETGALFSVDRGTGARTLLSNFGDPQQGPVAGDPVDVAVGTAGDILVVEEDFGGHGALFRIDPISGARTLLSNFGNGGQGPVVTTPHGVALGPDGDILVATVNGGTGGRGTLVRVNPMTGVRTLVSDFGDATQGPLGTGPEAVAPLDAGHVLVVDPDAQSPAGSPNNGLLFRVNLATGARTIVSDFSELAQGMRGIDPADVEVEANGSLVVVDASTPTAMGAQGTLFRIDPLTGNRTVLSDFTDASKGPTGRRPSGVAVEPGGGILVLDNAAGTNGDGALFRVNPLTGARTVVSDFGDAGQGPIGEEPVGVTMYPENGLLTFCGDGVRDSGEQCDDGNAAGGDGCSATCRLEGVAGLDRYLCYKTKPPKGSVLFVRPLDIELANRLETVTVDVKGAGLLCNPADVDGSGMVDPLAHLREYDLKEVPGSPKFVKRVGIGVVTEFGSLTLDLKSRDALLVPAVKSLSGPTSPPVPGAADRYRCYGVKVRSEPGPEPSVLVADQFDQPTTFRVLAPTRLCVPTSVDGADLVNPLADLLCYKIKPAKGQPKHVPVAGITAHDEFAIWPLQSVKGKELCVPAETTPGAP